MKARLFVLALAGLVLASLACSLFSSPEPTSEPQPTEEASAAPTEAPTAAPPSGTTAGCKMKASQVAWVTLKEDGSIDQQVDAYPSGATTITPVFQYNCVPKKVTIVTVFTFNGETVFTDKEALKASNSKGSYGYPLGAKDNSALDDGEWGVEFYNDKTLLISGTVTVGAGGGQTSSTAGAAVTVQGTVTDKKTKKPINGAFILVLNPGVTVQNFIDGGKQDSDVYTAAQTDSKGKFALEKPLERNTPYSLIVVAKGYKPIGEDGLTIGDSDPDPLELNVALTK